VGGRELKITRRTRRGRYVDRRGEVKEMNESVPRTLQDVTCPQREEGKGGQRSRSTKRRGKEQGKYRERQTAWKVFYHLLKKTSGRKVMQGANKSRRAWCAFSLPTGEGKGRKTLAT